MKRIFLYSFAVALLAFFISCSKSGSDDSTPANACDGVAKTFSGNVNPIVQTFCNQAGCHNTGSVNGPGPLTNYTQVFSARSAIRAAVQSGIMPKNATLSTTQKNTIICWIDSGAPND